MNSEFIVSEFIECLKMVLDRTIDLTNRDIIDDNGCISSKYACKILGNSNNRTKLKRLAMENPSIKVGKKYKYSLIVLHKNLKNV